MRKGGSYIDEGGGEAKLVERTEDHPQGNRARDAAGEALPVKPPAPPAPSDQAPAKTRKASKE